MTAVAEPNGPLLLRRVLDAGAAVVDAYGAAVARVELHAPRWPPLAELLALAPAGVPHVVALLRPAGGKSEMRILRGDPPVMHVVHELLGDACEVRYAVRCVDPDAPGTGVFVDHHHGRAFVAANARGKTVLNLFAHAGAFGAAAVAGGAARVDHVDAAKKCAPWAALNVALNGGDPRQHRFLVDDALEVIRKRAAKNRHAQKTGAVDGAGYDIVVCDPPTTAIRPGGKRFHVERDLGTLAADCCAALNPGGALVLSCNDRNLSAADVADLARQGAAAAGRVVASVATIPLAPGVKTEAMRGVILQLRVSARGRPAW